jgi:Erv1 / Alr family
MATKIWGPQGWMTLHSISTIYPEKMELLKKFMNLFEDTITCPDCKNHFSRMFNSYKQTNPSWFASRSQFFLFVARAHNTVNLRIDKPRIPSVAECIDTIRRNTLVTSGSIYRNTYINYLIRNWSHEYTGESFILAQSARELAKINNEYWNARDTASYDFVVPESDIMTPIVHVPMRQNYFTGQQVQVSTKIPTYVRVSFITKQLMSVRK